MKWLWQPVLNITGTQIYEPLPAACQVEVEQGLEPDTLAWGHRHLKFHWAEGPLLRQNFDSGEEQSKEYQKEIYVAFLENEHGAHIHRKILNEGWLLSPCSLQYWLQQCLIAYSVRDITAAQEQGPGHILSAETHFRLKPILQILLVKQHRLFSGHNSSLHGER